ncbi:hypothetical protein ONZ45_g12368 [Pleurotus djamor]|nr:hypothetical protein ONZ45_g12368 [Pleurotus djamor]
MPICGCGKLFASRGFRQHQQASQDPTCRRAPDVSMDPNAEASNSEDIRPDRMHNEDYEIDFDPQGDYFCDYAELFDPDGDTGNIAIHDEDSDSDTDLDGQATLAEETGLEPKRQRSEELHDEPVFQDIDDTPPMRLRGGAEVELQNKPFVVKFPDQNAGRVYSRTLNGGHTNEAYTTLSGGGENLYHPFASKIDWEVAHWAKTRGPSSTAFTDLMQIEGVGQVLSVAAA